MMKFWMYCARAALVWAGISITGCTALPAPQVVGKESTQGMVVRSWVTLTDQSKLLSREADTHFESTQALSLSIEIDASKRYQEMVGFGANITDASAWLIQHRMSEQQRTALLEELFGKAPGLGFSFTRLTIGASDFSLKHYSLDDVASGETDYPLAKFSIDPMRAEVIPVLRQAMAINPKLTVMASPWSAPAWMKTNSRLSQGTLRPDAYDVYARYFGKFVDAMEAEGIPMYAVTVQNEPHFEPNDYPSMGFNSASRAQFIGEHLGPLFAKRSRPIRILDWDHNWDEPQAPLAVLADDKARSYIAGVAWHCYKGDPEAQSHVRDAYPDKDAYFTECSGGEGNAKWNETFPWNMRNLIIGATRNWAKSVLMWNLALDDNYGPHKGGCGDCRGIVIINSKTGEVTRNLDYYALAHASRFVRVGARRIESTTGIDGLESVAFQNADDHSIALIVLNSAKAPRQFSVRQAGQTFGYQLHPGSAATFVWNANPARDAVLPK
jgi:glucosylceramidase